MNNLRNLAAAAALAALGAISVGCSPTENATTTTELPTTTKPPTTSEGPDGTAAPAAGYPSPDTETVSFCDPLVTVFASFTDMSFGMQDLESLAADLDTLAEASAGESPEVSAAAADLAGALQEAQLQPGDVGANLQDMSEADPSLAAATFTIIQSALDMCPSASAAETESFVGSD